LDLTAFTRDLVDVPSLTGEEAAVGRLLAERLAAWGFEVSTQPVDGDRFNVLARVGDPLVVLSTHMDTVPPFIPFREDETRIHGRGACDAKGIVAAMVFAARLLRDEGAKDFGLLFVVGEEDGSQGAIAANLLPNRCRYLVNGEPTESQQATGGKGVLRVLLEASGRAAHAAYPERGDSAIEKLLDVLADIRGATWPVSDRLGPTTCNIGVISGGIKANVIPDAASAELMFRTVTDPEEVLAQTHAVVRDRVHVKPGLRMRPIETHTVSEIGGEETVVRFGTDIPWLDRWGEPLLFGPGSIHVAHTPHEFIEKAEQARAVETYAAMTRVLLARAAGGTRA
jgi:acetylornithine deacetylase